MRKGTEIFFPDFLIINSESRFLPHSGQLSASQPRFRPGKNWRIALFDAILPRDMKDAAGQSSVANTPAALAAGFRAVLRDGAPVWLRPVQPGDRDRIAAGMAQLSPDSRYFRFFTAQSRLGDDYLQQLTHVDQQDQVAWIALDPVVAGEPGVGIGRFARSAAEPQAAEFALTVVDAWQQRGVGSLLFAALYALAWARGVREVRGMALPENRNFIQWCARLGAEARFANGVYTLCLPIREPAAFTAANASAGQFKRALEQAVAGLQMSRREM